MIIQYNLPVWPEDHPTQYYNTYCSIIQNFLQAFENKYPNNNVLFIDNTYLNAQQTVDIIKKNSCDVVAVFSFVDPPYTWHYLQEVLDNQFPDIQKHYIGNESPDIKINFFWMLCFNEMPRYTTDEVLPTTFDYVYLNYNSKPHQHRVNLLKSLRDQGLDKIGFNTLQEDIYMQPGIVQSLGDLSIWQRHFLNIDSATVFRLYDSQLLISEKEFKPLLGLRPFVINGSARYYQELQTLGFDTFDDVLPIALLSEEFDTVEQTMTHCHRVICDLISDLAKENLANLYAKLLPRLHSNREVFYEHGNQLVAKWCHEPINL